VNLTIGRKLALAFATGIAIVGASAAASLKSAGVLRQTADTVQGQIATLASSPGGAAIQAPLRRAAAEALLASERANFIAFTTLLLVVCLAPVAFVVVRRELAWRAYVAQAMAESETRFRAAVDGSRDAFYILRAVRDGSGALLDFEFLDVNAQAETLLGRPAIEIIGQRLCELIPANRTSGFLEKYAQVVQSRDPIDEECRVPSQTLSASWVHHQIVPLNDGVAITSRDITERKEREEELRAMSMVDEMTGLYNRRGFLMLAEQQLRMARRGHRELVLLFVDMDDFKQINDQFGHAEGDAALQKAAAILRRTFRDSDILARLGGDEFVVLASDASHGSADLIVSRLSAELRQQNARGDGRYLLSFSVGAATFTTESPPSIEELLSAADAMLYEQKRGRRVVAKGAA
jgi:diguanylate cyclase (GGDEF)-like protein/PAS domain S-box-containing protein